MGKKSEKGNVIELVIIIVLVLAVTGLLVWRFVDSNKTASTTNNTDTATVKTEQIPNQSGTQSTTQQTNPNEGYIVIDDWGVRFKPEGSSKYTFSKVSSADYGFSTSTLEALGKYCTASEGKVNLVRHTSPSAPQNEVNYGTPLHGGVPINGYYYFYLGPQSAGCSDNTPSNQDVNTEVEQVNQIKSLLFTIEAKQ